MAELEEALKAGPQAHGFATALWTTQRMARLIRQRWNVRYHSDHMCRLLQKLGWSCQRPTTRARQRDETAIQRWKKVTWPALKKVQPTRPEDRLSRRKRLESETPSGAHLGAQRPDPPGLEFDFTWKNLSVIAGLTLWRFYFRLHPGPIKSAQVIEFLQHLQRHVRGRLLVIWDGAMIHRSRAVRDDLDGLGGKIWAETLPAYAPELNPAEYIWGHLKQHELPNLCAQDLSELGWQGRAALRRMRRRPTLITAFWKQAELF
jgi:transposase